MIDLPEGTHVHRRIPKEAFYKRLQITNALKNKFVSDIDSIYAEYSLTKDSLHLEKDGQIKEIVILLIELKKKSYDQRILEHIARQNSHKLLFILSFNDSYQLALYHKKLFHTEWLPKSIISLYAKGFSVDLIWDNLIEQVVLSDEIGINANLSIDDRIEKQEQIIKLNQEISRLDSATWKEQQPKKKFELYKRKQELEKQLEAFINGQDENAYS